MKNGVRVVCFTLSVFIFHSFVLAQGFQKKITINWNGVQTLPGFGFEPVKALCADGLQNNTARNFTPEYFEKFALPPGIGSCNILLTHAEWEAVGDTLLKSLTFPLLPGDSLSPVVETGTERGTKMVMLTMVPVVANPSGGIMRLKSFTIDIAYLPDASKNESLKSNAYAIHSVLSQGNWYKIKLNKTGIYKVTYADLKDMGVDMSSVTPANIRLFGNGGGILPEANNVPRYDDLTENAITVVTANPSTFAAGDYFLFYGTAPDKIEYNRASHRFEHTMNIYSDYTYYFLNFDSGVGLRITIPDQLSLTPNYICTNFTEGVFYETDQLNFINSGKDWVGERMDVNSPVFELPEFTFPNVVSTKQSWIKYRLTARATTKTDFSVTVNGNSISNPSCGVYSQYVYATAKTDTKSFFPESEDVKVSFRFNGTGTSIGWLDWVELNVVREMKFTGGQLAFADPYSVYPGNITEFQLQDVPSNIKIWDVTDPLQVKLVNATIQGSLCSFVLKTDSIRRFVAWDNTSFLSAQFAGKVANQDLHGIAGADLLIVTPDDYLGQANRLAAHHREADGMRVTVATNEQVYNEFSSGSPDVAAIRDFARMLFNRPEAGNKLRYLLLFGDGSFDFKDRVPQNTNRVLTFQAKESLDVTSSFVSDDFFGMLDDNEGLNAVGLIDIGIGRFPVSTVEQAKMAVDKCIFYSSNDEKSFGDWRNRIALISDDGDGNIHFGQAEYQLAPLIEKKDSVYNLNKAYTDAYKQISSPTGERCPDMNAAITSNVENGVLVMNYTGHGGETGWATEGILTVGDIDSWTNYNNMPVFMTATCEFSRYDDPNRVSAGEHVFLNPLGGGIALFTTTRLASPIPNIALNKSFYDTLLAKNNGEYPRFGDVIAYAKNNAKPGDATMIRNFTLLGDPALRLAYPENKVITTSVNGHSLNGIPDTISAMSTVEIKGIIADGYGNKLSGFSGKIYVKVFDKERILTTLGSDPHDWPDTFKVQDNYIYQGSATVSNGDFTVNFIVPRDIDYSFGPGKISYYAHNDTTDANGYCNQVVIGGSGNEISDNNGPGISLYINDLNFRDGGITGDTPLLIAKLTDESGINTINNAIGHEIVATLDGENSTSKVLNSFYSADVDSYKSGEVRYKFAALSEGKHTLTLKAWDVFNNSSEATITFKVSSNIQISITNISVYPNPFSDEVKVDFGINLFDTPVSAHLEVFNINGALVSSTESQLLLSQGYQAGTLSWNGRNVSGNAVSPGIYLVTVHVTNGKSESVKAARLVKLK
jgi:hypothetical protein